MHIIILSFLSKQDWDVMNAFPLFDFSDRPFKFLHSCMNLAILGEPSYKIEYCLTLGSNDGTRIREGESCIKCQEGCKCSELREASLVLRREKILQLQSYFFFSLFFFSSQYIQIKLC